MKKLFGVAILYSLYTVSYAPQGLSAESLLAARAITQGQVPYRDFMLHIGPVPAYLFAFLFSVPIYVWCSLVFVMFNIITAWVIYKMGGYGPAILFLFIAPLYGGSQMYVETIMTTFGILGIYLAGKRNYWVASAMFILAMGTKLTGLVFPVAALIGGWCGKMQVMPKEIDG